MAEGEKKLKPFMRRRGIDPSFPGLRENQNGTHGEGPNEHTNVHNYPHDLEEK